MKQAYKKRPHLATANSPPVLSDMGKLLYKSGKFYIWSHYPSADLFPSSPKRSSDYFNAGKAITYLILSQIEYLSLIVLFLYNHQGSY